MPIDTIDTDLLWEVYIAVTDMSTHHPWIGLAVSISVDTHAYVAYLYQHYTLLLP